MTALGRAWAQQYLNPCHSELTASLGVPTGSASETAIVRSRSDVDVIAPTDLSGAWTNPMSENWYLAIIIPPWVDDVAILVAAAFQPTDFAGLDDLVQTAPVFPEWKSSTTTVDLHKTVWFSKITEPGFEQWTPDDRDENLASSYRMVKRGVTTELVYDDFSKRGRVTAGQWLVEPDIAVWNYGVTVNQAGGTTEAVVGDSGACKQFLVGDLTPQRITAINSKAYQNNAFEGCYMPIYLNSQEHEFLPYNWYPIDLLIANTNDPAITVKEVGGGSGKRYYPKLPYKVVNKHQNIGVIWYQGISGAASVRIKSRHDIEVVTPPGSKWSAFSQAAAPEDPIAIMQVHAIQNRLDQAYPACYNDWGVLGTVIKGLLSKAVPFLANLAHGIVDKGQDLLTGLL